MVAHASRELISIFALQRSAIRIQDCVLCDSVKSALNDYRMMSLLVYPDSIRKRRLKQEEQISRAIEIASALLQVIEDVEFKQLTVEYLSSCFNALELLEMFQWCLHVDSVYEFQSCWEDLSAVTGKIIADVDRLLNIVPVWSVANPDELVKLVDGCGFDQLKRGLPDIDKRLYLDQRMDPQYRTFLQLAARCRKGKKLFELLYDQFGCYVQESEIMSALYPGTVMDETLPRKLVESISKYVWQSGFQIQRDSKARKRDARWRLTILASRRAKLNGNVPG